MDLLCRIADAAREAARWLQDMLAVAVLTASAIGLAFAIFRAIQVATGGSSG